MKRCLILGGSGYLGRAVRARLAEAGARVAYTWHATAPEDAGPLALRADLRVVAEIEAAVDRAVEALGGLDGLVHCAAVGRTPPPDDAAGALDEIDEVGWDEVMAVNVKAAFFAVRRALPAMTAGGDVVLIGSIDGVKPVPTPIHYGTSKAALDGMTRALAKALGPVGVRVNTVHPGVLEDGISRMLSAELVAEHHKHCALKRRGRAGEIATVVARLVLDNTYLTGQSIVVDGGL